MTASPADAGSSSKSTERFVLTAKIDVATDADLPRIDMTHIRDAVYALLGRDVSDPLHPVVGDEVGGGDGTGKGNGVIDSAPCATGRHVSNPNQ